jgi:hypothetical protein
MPLMGRDGEVQKGSAPFVLLRLVDLFELQVDTAR